MSTLLNKQDQYNTDRQKSEIKKLMGLLEERRGSDNGKDDSDHN